jgi:hypothetical protein
LANWWKCQILSNTTVTIPFVKGDVAFAKSVAEWIMLFDGRREVMIPKMATKNIRFLSRLNQKDAEPIERDYQLKRAAKITWDRKIVVG